MAARPARGSSRAQECADGSLVCISGASRSGKTARVIQLTRDDARCVAWDPEDQLWADAKMRRVDSVGALLGAMAKAGRGPLRVALVPAVVSAEAHSAWSASVLWWSRECGPCSAIAEELADVSSPGKASAGWGQLVRRGLKRGAAIYAISQRWAEADKTVVGNAGRFLIFRQSTRQDVAYMASRVDVPADVIAGLGRLEYVDYDGVEKTWMKKIVTF